GAFVEFPFGVRSILVDVMQKDLRSMIARKCFTPVIAITSTVNQRVARSQRNGCRAHWPFYPNRPRVGGGATQIQSHADFAGRPIAMTFENVASLVNTEVSISREKT